MHNMPTQLQVNQTSPSTATLTLQFLDASNNVVAAPSGAVVSYTTNGDFQNVFQLEATSDQTVANLSIIDPSSSFTPEVVVIVASVSGANDVGGSPYADAVIYISPFSGRAAVPATPPVPAGFIFSQFNLSNVPLGEL